MNGDSLATPILTSPNLKDKPESDCGVMNRFAVGTVQVRIFDNRPGVRNRAVFHHSLLTTRASPWFAVGYPGDLVKVGIQGNDF